MKHETSEIRGALTALLSDIESMYEGAESPGEGRQSEEFFGSFSVWKLDHSGFEPVVTVSWPSLAISVRNAMAVLRESDTADPIG